MRLETGDWRLEAGRFKAGIRVWPALVILLAACGSLPTAKEALEAQILSPGALALRARKLPPVAVVVTVTARAKDEVTAENTAALGVKVDAVTGESMEERPDAAGAMDVDPVILANALVEGLRELGIFEDVYLVSGDEGGDGAARKDHFFLLREATTRGAAFLVEVKLDQVELVHAGGEEAVSSLAWFFGGIANQWMRNETFRMSMVPSVRIFDINAAEFLPEFPLGSAEATLALNFHERTSSIWTYFKTNFWPSNMTAPDQAEVAERIAPSALAGATARFAGYLAEVTAGREYEFEILDNQHQALPVVQVYPPPGKRTLVLTEKVHLELAFQSAGEGALREVKLNEDLIWPVGLGEDEQVPVRRKYLFKTEAPVTDRKLYSFTALDAQGNQTRYALRAKKAQTTE